MYVIMWLNAKISSRLGSVSRSWSSGSRRKGFRCAVIALCLSLLAVHSPAQRKPTQMDIPHFILTDLHKPSGVDDSIWAETLDFELSHQWVKAAKAWEQIATQQDPNWNTGQLRAVARYLQGGDQENAQRNLEALEPLNPLHEQALIHMKGLMAWLKRDDRTAWRTLMSLVQEKQAFTETYHLLARIGIAQDEPAEAIGWLRHTLKGVDQDQRVTLANHQIFAALHKEAAYRSLLREMGAFSLVEDGNPEEAEPLPPHLRTRLKIKDFTKSELRPRPKRSADEGGYYYQGLFLIGEEDIQVEEKE